MGVIPRVIKDIFGKYKTTHDFTITFSLIEVHQDEIYDLLAKKPKDKCVLDIQESFLQGKTILFLRLFLTGEKEEMSGTT